VNLTLISGLKTRNGDGLFTGVVANYGDVLELQRKYPPVPCEQEAAQITGISPESPELPKNTKITGITRFLEIGRTFHFSSSRIEWG
jgi:hypothetical protein